MKQPVSFPSGKEIFVGVGKRTNPLGAKAVADAFSDHTVSLLDITNSDLGHLKDGFAMAGREIMAVAPGTDCAIILKVPTTKKYYSTNCQIQRMNGREGRHNCCSSISFFVVDSLSV